MRFLAKRFAAERGAYFLKESKVAVSFLRQSPRIPADKTYCVVAKAVSVEGQTSQDVLADGSSSSTAELNPLRADVSLPPGHIWSQKDLYDAQVDPETLKATAEGLAYVWKAFGIATVIVFGGTSLIFGLVATKFEIHSRDAIRVKARGLIQRKLEMVREQLVPQKRQAENLSQRWRGAEIAEQNPAVKEVSEALGAKAS